MDSTKADVSFCTNIQSRLCHMHMIQGNTLLWNLKHVDPRDADTKQRWVDAITFYIKYGEKLPEYKHVYA